MTRTFLCVADNPFENAELERAERAVARLPRPSFLPPRGPASQTGRVLAVMAPASAIATVAVQMKFSFAPTTVISVWVALMALVALTVAMCLAAGELGGRWGRVSGILSGIVIVPPIGIALAWWLSEPFRWLV